MAKQIGPAEEQRANHYQGVIRLSEGNDVSTVLHEIGHALEYRYPEAAEASRAFLKKRQGAEQPQKLKDVAGGSYEDHEIGIKDKFDKAFDESGWYVGKQYAHGSTEIMSMGLQKAYENPAEFAKKDPEFFKFVTGILTGRLR